MWCKQALLQHADRLLLGAWGLRSSRSHPSVQVRGHDRDSARRLPAMMSCDALTHTCCSADRPTPGSGSCSRDRRPAELVGQAVPGQSGLAVGG